MGGCCDDFVPGGRDGGGGGGGGLTNAIQTISGGTTNATGPGVSFANSNNISFGITGNTITASVVPDAGIGLAAGTQTMATGTAIFSNSNGISFGLNASTITASVAAIKALSGGTTNATGTGVSFANGSGVSFGVNGNTITASVASQTPETPFGLSAGTQSVSTGTVVFSNSNNVSFGLSGSSRITASASFPAETPFGLSAGTQSVSTGTVAFANSNGVSFGMSGSNQITASFSAPPAETPFGISAGTQSVSTGTMVFSNSNNVTFGMSGSSRITASASFPAETPFALSAGTQSVSTGTVNFSNSNGVTFGMSGSNVVTASVALIVAPVTYSLFVPMLDPLRTAVAFEQSTLRVQGRTTPYLTWSHVGMLHQFSGNAGSTGTASFSRQLGIYTKNASTLSLLMSTSFSISINHSGGGNAPINNGVRMITTGWSSSLSAGDYYFANVDFSATAGDNVSISQILGNNSMANGFNGYAGQNTSVAAARSAMDMFGNGYLSVATAALPNSIAISDIWAADTNTRRPFYFQLVVSV